MCRVACEPQATCRPPLGLKFSASCTQKLGAEIVVWCCAALGVSESFQYQDMPNGLAALSKLPVLGGAQIIAFAGLIETTGIET